MSKKLTLNVDPDVIARGKVFARKNGTTLSAMVERMLHSVSIEETRDDLPPLTARLYGLAAGAELPADPRAAYRDHIEQKHQ